MENYKLETRRWMARERRGVGSFLAIMKIPYYKPIYQRYIKRNRKNEY